MLSLGKFSTERIRRLATEGTWIVFGQVATFLGALAGVRLLTELLDPSAYGELGLGMTAGALLNQVLLGPLSNGATRFYSAAIEQSDVSGYLSGVSHLLLRAAGVIGLILLATIAGLLTTERSSFIGITIAVVIFALVSGCNSILSGIQNAARQRSVVALHQAAEVWARFLIAALLIQTLHSTSTMAVWGYVAGSFLIFISQYRHFRKTHYAQRASNQKLDWQIKIWQYSWPFGAWGVFTGLQLASDRWALEHFATTQEVGFYVVLFQLGYAPISMVTGMAMQFIAPILFERAGDAGDMRRNELVNKITYRLTALALGLTCLVSFLALCYHRQIFNLLVAKEYSSVSSLLPWMILSGGIFAAGQTIALNLMSQMRTYAMVRVKIFTALFGILLNFVGAHWYGIAGVIFAGVAFSISYLVWMIVISTRMQKITLTKN
jgi:O-antigen/teichoic acid export membrane protein